MPAAQLPSQGRVAHLTLDPAFPIAEVDRRLFGSFVEHMGRCVYTGIFEPGHATATEDGFRQDVLEMAREMGVTVVRYPGGNFVSSYRWEDGVGPVDERPVRLDLAWRGIEPNTMGLNEFMRWAKLADVEPMMAVNLGTRGVQDALDLLEYCNHTEGTYWSDLRRSHGVKEPHDVRLWCLGNELDGPWQMGQKTATEYGRLAAETAKAMRMVDPDIELVAVGSSNSGMPQFGAWEAEVLRHTYEHVDYISLHDYYEEVDTDRASFLASSADMDRFIGSVVATADHVGATLRSRKQLKLSFDEWNVWYQKRFVGQNQLDWEFARPLIEDDYTALDAVVVGSLLVTLLKHADRVGVACQAQLVNVIAPIRTEPGGAAWRQSIFYPFAFTSELARGTVLRVEPRSPVVDTTRYGEVPALDATATYDAESGSCALFVVNRDPSEDLDLEVDLRAVATRHGELRIARHLVIAAGDPEAAAASHINSAAHPDRVRPVAGEGARLVDGRLTVRLPAASWAVLHLMSDLREGDSR